MTITQTQLLWTCLPNGFAVVGSEVNLSLVVTPQLSSNDLAGQVETIAGTVFQNWPAYVRMLATSNAFVINFGQAAATFPPPSNGFQGLGQLVDHLSANPSSGLKTAGLNIDASTLWGAIFPPSTQVTRAQSGDAPAFKVLSYDAPKIAEAIRAAHRHTVESHAMHGKLVLTGSDPYSTLLNAHRRAKALFPKMRAALKGAPHGSTHESLRTAYHAEAGELDLGYELVRHALYFDNTRHRSDKNPDAEPLATRRHADGTTVAPMASDFNTLIAHLGGQPTLMRKLGLIIDLVIPLPSLIANTLPAANSGPQANTETLWSGIPNPNLLPAAAQATFQNAIDPSGKTTVNLNLVTNLYPSTRYDATKNLFRASNGVASPTPTSGGSINNGFLPLGDGNQYSIYFEDTEGTPFKLESVAQGPSTSDATPPFPALRTAGLAIAQKNRETVLAGPSANPNAPTSLLGRQTNLANNIWGGKTLDFSSQQVSAEDLVRGYAVEVAVGPNPTPTSFKSLTLRDSRLTFPGLATSATYPAGSPTSFVLSDEGYTKATTANEVPPATAGGASELDLHPALFGFEGWSLAVQRPGRAITAAVPAGDIVQTETPLPPNNTNTGFTFPSAQVNVRTRAGSIPKLRFGTQYTFRARVFDLAGNDTSVPSTGTVPQVTTGLPLQTTTTTYLRYEPVPNPVMVLQNPVTEGEHLENLVIRSNPWGFGALGPSDYAAHINATANPLNPYPTTGQTARWIAPPKGAWGQAEQLGAFDPYFSAMATAVHNDITTPNPAVPTSPTGLVVPGQPYGATQTSGATNNSIQFANLKNMLYAASQKEAGAFTDTQVWNTQSTVSGGLPSASPVSYDHSALVQIITPPMAVNAAPPTDPGQPLATGQYNILKYVAATPPVIPYLPDANAQGIAIQQLDLNGNIVGYATRTYVPRTGLAWPEIDMPQLVLTGGAPTAVPGPLPQVGFGSAASNVSGLDPSAPPPSTPGGPLPAGFSPPPTSSWLTFTLAPGQQMTITYGSTVADTTKMANNDINASVSPGNNTPLTNGGPPTIPTFAPTRTLNLVHAVQQPRVPTYLNPSAPAMGAINARNQGDTSVVIQGGFGVDGTTANNVDLGIAWVDLVDSEMTTDVQPMNDGSNRRYVVKSGRLASWTLDLTHAACQYQASPTPTPNQIVTQPLVQQFGDTKTRQIFFQATATSRFREYFPASLQADGTNFQNALPGGVLATSSLLNQSGVRVPATSRPNTPKILYVMPTFAWQQAVRTAAPKTTTNTRSGRGLRVYVDRPWYTTGDTEMLGVVVTNTPGQAIPPTSTQPYVSTWGQDPTRGPQADASTAAPGAGTAIGLTGAAIDQNMIVGETGTPYTNIPLLENGALVTVVAFPPTAFDEARNLWYFDIELAASAVESPFVRLALVRFQPNALGAPGFTAASGTPDLRMSNVVLTDMVKTGADRTAVYLVNADSSVSMNVSGHVQASGPPWTPNSSAIPANTYALNNPASLGRVFYAQVQEATSATPGDFDWKPVGLQYLLAPFQSAGPANSTLLTYAPVSASNASITIPKPSGLTAGMAHRLLVTEHEVLLTDGAVAFPQPVQGSGAPAGPTVQGFPSGIQGAGMTPLGPNVAQLPSTNGNPGSQGTTSRILFSDTYTLPY